MNITIINNLSFYAFLIVIIICIGIMIFELANNSINTDLLSNLLILSLGLIILLFFTGNQNLKKNNKFKLYGLFIITFIIVILTYLNNYYRVLKKLGEILLTNIICILFLVASFIYMEKLSKKNYNIPPTVFI